LGGGAFRHCRKLRGFETGPFQTVRAAIQAVTISDRGGCSDADTRELQVASMSDDLTYGDSYACPMNYQHFVGGQSLDNLQHVLFAFDP
jgi:hypothetical protein